MFFFWVLFVFVTAKNDVILSSGLENFDRVQLDHQYNLFSLYQKMNLISSSSMLIYNIDVHGHLDTYKTNDSSVTAEYFQILLTNDLGLKAYPCLYCDATSGFCSDLNSRLENMYKNQSIFIWSVLERLLENKFHGLYLDFEPDGTINWTKLTTFVLELSNVLHLFQLPVFLWFGYGTLYDARIFSAVNVKIISMDTYTNTYIDFVHSASKNLELLSNSNMFGAGLLTSKKMSEKDLLNVVQWCAITNITSITLWASTISGFAYKALHLFLSN